MTVQILDLGWCIGRFNSEKGMLTIVSPSDNSDGFFTPAEAISIHSKLALITLRDALNAAYPDKGE